MMPAKFAHQQQVDIIDMARSNVAVSSCLRRLGNWCLSNGVDVEEGKQALSADFQQQVLPQYVRFFRQCLEAMYVCGFIPWYTSELDGTRFPVVLPLGSFTWTVEQTERLEAAKGGQKRRRLEIYRYRITVLNGDVKESDVGIIEFMPPRPSRSAASCSPMHALYERYQIMKRCDEMLMAAAEYNSHKHVFFTEKVNITDQTTAGIQLLDDFRRYTLTGTVYKKGRANDDPMFNRSKEKLSTVNDGSMHWLQDQFDSDVKTHVLPPNMEAHEMQNLDSDEYVRTQESMFIHSVHMFFDLPYSIAATSARDRAGQTEHLLSDEQYTNVRCLCDFLQVAGEATYKKIYGAAHVKFTLRARPRLSISNTDDVKKLMEAGIFAQRDGFKLRRMFLDA